MLILEAFIDCTLTFFKCSIFVRDLIIGQCGTSLLLLVLVIPENSVKELLRAPRTIKDRIKKLLAHKNSMRQKVKMKNIAEPRGTPTAKVDWEPFSSEESISRDGNPHGEKKRQCALLLKCRTCVGEGHSRNLGSVTEGPVPSLRPEQHECGHATCFQSRSQRNPPARPERETIS